MKVKLKYGYRYVDDLDEDGFSLIQFKKNGIYDVVHQFEHEDFGDDNHTVYVIINDSGETMSVGCEVVEIVEE